MDHRRGASVSKPDWLKDTEGYKEPRVHTYCYQCKDYLGERIGTTMHKGKEKVEVWACASNPKTYNTKYSICCTRFQPK